MARTVTTWGDQLVLAVDPGGTTGWLLFRPLAETDDLGAYLIEPIEWGEERSQIAFCNRVWSLATQKHPTTKRSLDHIVIEAWRPRGGVMSWEPEAVEITGFCRWVMADSQASFTIQEVAHAESWGTDRKTRPYRAERVPPLNVGRGGEGHAVMALKHALLWAATRWSPEEPAA